MLRFILGRLGYGLLTVWFIATATFVGMHAVPGDPLRDERAVPPEIRRNLEARYGLDQPLGTQYLRYLGNMLRGDFGVSFTQQNREVNDIIRRVHEDYATLRREMVDTKRLARDHDVYWKPGN